MSPALTPSLRLASMRKKVVHLLITTEQVLKKELLEFQQRHIDPTSASLLAESLSLQLFGYITLLIAIYRVPELWVKDDENFTNSIVTYTVVLAVFLSI